MAYRLSRHPASGIFGDFGHRTLWDEFCYEVQYGPTSQLEGAWDHTLSGFAQAVVEQMPAHVAALLSWYLADRDDARRVNDAICAGDIGEAVIAAARGRASERDPGKIFGDGW